MELPDGASLEASGVTEGGVVVVVRKVLVAEGARPCLGNRRTTLTPGAGWKIASGGDSDSDTDADDF